MDLNKGFDMSGYKKIVDAADNIDEEDCPFNVSFSQKEFHEPQSGFATFDNNELNVKWIGPKNYWYIPAQVDAISYCVIDPRNKNKKLYVVSDNFSGCDFHVLGHSSGKLAFLHVYRNQGGAVSYTPKTGWYKKIMKYSKGLINTFGHSGNILAFACIDANQPRVNIETQFIHLDALAKIKSTVDDGEKP
ncbi:MAG: hypothetical protein AAGB12_03585 [Pseudomonadota bacterium]